MDPTTAPRFDAGDILLIQYPHTDRSGSKIRPALVVSGDKYNRGDDFVIVPISSIEPKSLRYSFPILDTDKSFAATKLKKSSYVKWTKPYTISGMVVIRRLGCLPNSILSEVQAKIRGVFGG